MTKRQDAIILVIEEQDKKLNMGISIKWRTKWNVWKNVEKSFLCGPKKSIPESDVRNEDFETLGQQKSEEKHSVADRGSISVALTEDFL